MKKIISLCFLIIVLLVVGCENIDVSQLSDEDLQRISDKLIVCNNPYIRFGSSCCLDRDNSDICDRDERELSELEKKQERQQNENIVTATPKQLDKEDGQEEVQIDVDQTKFPKVERRLGLEVVSVNDNYPFSKGNNLTSVQIIFSKAENQRINLFNRYDNLDIELKKGIDIINYHQDDYGSYSKIGDSIKLGLKNSGTETIKDCSIELNNKNFNFGKDIEGKEIFTQKFPDYVLRMGEETYMFVSPSDRLFETPNKAFATDIILVCNQSKQMIFRVEGQYLPILKKTNLEVEIIDVKRGYKDVYYSSDEPPEYIVANPNDFKKDYSTSEVLDKVYNDNFEKITIFNSINVSLKIKNDGESCFYINTEYGPLIGCKYGEDSETYSSFISPGKSTIKSGKSGCLNNGDSVEMEIEIPDLSYFINLGWWTNVPVSMPVDDARERVSMGWLPIYHNFPLDSKNRANCGKEMQINV